MLCVHHCHSTVVPSPLAPPLIIFALDSQTLCPEERGRERGRRGGEKGKRVGGDGKMRAVVRQEGVTERRNNGCTVKRRNIQ